MRLTPARRATSASVVRLKPTSMTQSRAAASSGSSCRSFVMRSDTVTTCVTLYAMTSATTTHAGWGDPARRTGLPTHATSWLHREIGAGRRSLPVALPGVRLPAPSLDGTGLSAVVGAEHVLVDDEARVRHAAGRSYLD